MYIYIYLYVAASATHFTMPACNKIRYSGRVTTSLNAIDIARTYEMSRLRTANCDAKSE